MNTESAPCVQKNSKAIVEIFSPTAGAALVLEFEKSPKYLQTHVGRDGLPGAPHWEKDSYLIQGSRGHCTNPQELTDFLRNHIVTHSYSLQTPLTTVPCHLGHSRM